MISKLLFYPAAIGLLFAAYPFFYTISSADLKVPMNDVLESEWI